MEKSMRRQVLGWAALLGLFALLLLWVLLRGGERTTDGVLPEPEAALPIAASAVPAALPEPVSAIPVIGKKQEAPHSKPRKLSADEAVFISVANEPAPEPEPPKPKLPAPRQAVVYGMPDKAVGNSQPEH